MTIDHKFEVATLPVLASLANLGDQTEKDAMVSAPTVTMEITRDVDFSR